VRLRARFFFLRSKAWHAAIPPASPVFGSQRKRIQRAKNAFGKGLASGLSSCFTQSVKKKKWGFM
jgi:hypothetical protein